MFITSMSILFAVIRSRTFVVQMRPRKKPQQQRPTMRSVERAPRRIFGKTSSSVVCTVQTTENCVPMPSVMSIMKNMIAHSGDTGRRDTTSGYTMKAKPAPAPK